MDPPISTALVAKAIALAAADPAREACGLLLGERGVVTRLTEAANVAADPARTFEIDPAALIAAHRAARAGGPALLGCWHSHPSGDVTPSVHDAAAAQVGHYWLIVAGGHAALFRFGINGFVRIALDGADTPPCLAGDPPP